MILVTGANGQLARRIVRRLCAMLPGAGAGRLAVATRHPSALAALAPRGIDVRRADFDRPDTLAAAFTHVERLVLVSPSGALDERSARVRNAIAAAKAAGVGRVYYTSLLDADECSPCEVARVHAIAESELAASGLPFRVLRNAPYADLLPETFAAALADGVLRLPAGDGKLTYVSRDDLAEAIAQAVLAPRLEKPLYALTGETAHDCRELAAKVGRALGRPLRYESDTAAASAKALEAHGVPPRQAGALVSGYRAAADGRLGITTNDFAALVGHPPRSIDCLVAEFFGRA